MRIGLFGQFGTGNLGNDGSLEAILVFLRSRLPDAELVCICPNPRKVTEQYGIAATANFDEGSSKGWLRSLDRIFLGIPRRLRSFLYPFRAVRRFDAIIVPGTGFLDDFQEMPFGWPFMIFRWSLAAWFAGIRLAFVSIGAGPISHRVSRFFMSKASRLCSYRSFRDQASKDFMVALRSADPRDGVYPDLAFALPAPPGERRKSDSPLTVAVGVMSYEGWIKGGRSSASIGERYLDTISRFIARLLSRGHNVRLIIGEETDRMAVAEVQSRLGPTEAGRLVTPPETPSLHALMQQIAAADIVIATRFHNIVCALKVGRPTISLGYAHKNAALLDDLELGDFSQHVETINVERLEEQLAQALSERFDIEARIRSGIERYTRLLEDQGRRLLEVLGVTEAALTTSIASQPVLDGGSIPDGS